MTFFPRSISFLFLLVAHTAFACMFCLDEHHEPTSSASAHEVDEESGTIMNEHQATIDTLKELKARIVELEERNTLLLKRALRMKAAHEACMKELGDKEL